MHKSRRNGRLRGCLAFTPHAASTHHEEKTKKLKKEIKTIEKGKQAEGKPTPAQARMLAIEDREFPQQPPPAHVMGRGAPPDAMPLS